MNPAEEIEVYWRDDGRRNIGELLAETAASLGGTAYYVILTPNDIGSHLQVSSSGRVGRGYHRVNQWRVTVLKKK